MTWRSLINRLFFESSLQKRRKTVKSFAAYNSLAVGGFDLYFSCLVVNVFKPIQRLLESLFTMLGTTEASSLNRASRPILCLCAKTHLPAGLSIFECVFLDSYHIGAVSLRGHDDQIELLSPKYPDS